MNSLYDPVGIIFSMNLNAFKFQVTLQLVGIDVHHRLFDLSNDIHHFFSKFGLEVIQ